MTNLAVRVATAAAPEGGSGVGGWLVLVGALVGVVLMLVARRLRERSPWVWWPAFGALVTVWRIWRTWRPACEGAGLSVPARRFRRNGRFGLVGSGRSAMVVRGEPLRLLTPRRVALRLTACGLAVRVAMHPSQVPGDYARAAEAFAHAWRVHRVKAVSERPGFVTLVAVGFDPLRHPRSLDAGGRLRARLWLRMGVGETPETGGDAVPSGPEVLAVEVGVFEEGARWVVDLRRRAHHLVVGATRSGKSTLTARLIVGLAPRPVALVGIDAKGGMELSPFTARLSALATTRAQAAALVEALLLELEQRMAACAAAGARHVWELPEGSRPEAVVLVVDEVAELFLAVDRAGKEESARCVTGLVRLGQLGAALGVHLWICGQRFSSELGPGATLLRAQLAGRICHRVADRETAVMTLSGLPADASAAAEWIATDLPGVAVVADDSGAWGVARSVPASSDVVRAAMEAWADRCVSMPDLRAAVELAAAGEREEKRRRGNGPDDGSRGGSRKRGDR